MPIEQADQFGVIETAADGQTITAFREKPKDAVGLPDAPDQVYASMGNYVFSTDTLIDVVTLDAESRDSSHDMGGNIIPMLVESGGAHVYDFAANEVPGATERDRGYWRDVGTLDAFYDAHMDLISVHPVFNLYNMEWPILTLPEPLPPAKFVFADDDGRTGHALDSMVCSGVIISGATVQTSVLSPKVHLHSYAQVEGSVLFSGVEVGRGAVVRNAILDKDVYVEPGAEVGVDLDADREAGFTVSDGGVVVVPKGARVAAGACHDLSMRVALLTREYPPEVYGGAGVHVEYLARELASRVDLTVHCWGADRDDPPSTPTGRGRRWPAASRISPRCRRCRSTWSWPPASRAPRSSTATPGTPSSGATWPSSPTGSPTSRPSTRSSRCARGRPSSSAAATRCRASASGSRWRAPTP